MNLNDSTIANTESHLNVTVFQEHPADLEPSSDSSPDLPSSKAVQLLKDFSFISGLLTTRERNALTTLGITTVEAFCHYDFSQLTGVRGCGETTVNRLQRIQEICLEADQSHPITHRTSVTNLSLSYKENKALLSFGVVTVEDFLNADLSQVHSLEHFGERTYNALTQSRKRILAQLSDIHNNNESSLANSDDNFELNFCKT